MEKQLFSWTGWDQGDTAAFSFLDIVLAQDLDPYKKGERFSSANIDYETGKLELYRNDDDEVPTAAFQLRLIVEGQA